MRTLHGTIVFNRRGNKGFWYSLFSPDEGKVDFFSRHDSLLLFDRIEASLLCRHDTSLLTDWSLLDRSPLVDHPEHLAAAGYFAHLIACFTEAGPRENAFVETTRSFLEGRLDRTVLQAAEKLWGTAMGTRVEDEADLDDLIRGHSAGGHRIRRYLLNDLARAGGSHA